MKDLGAQLFLFFRHFFLLYSALDMRSNQTWVFVSFSTLERLSGVLVELSMSLVWWPVYTTSPGTADRLKQLVDDDAGDNDDDDDDL